MTRVYEIDAEKIDAHRERVVETLQKPGFYKTISSLSEVPERPSPELGNVVDAIEESLGVYWAVQDQVEDSDIFAPVDDHDEAYEQFKNGYALYLGSMVGAKELGAQDIEQRMATGFEETLEQTASEQTVQTQLVKQYLQTAAQASGDTELEQRSRDYFTSIAAECIEYLDGHPEYAETVHDVEIEVRDYTFNGYGEKGTVRGLQTEDVAFDEIIGNEDVKDGLQNVLDFLFMYDTEDHHNPASEEIDLPNSMLIYGDPGTGKTMTLKAAATYAADRAEELEKDLDLIHIDQSFKDKHFGESSSNLREQFEELRDPDSIGLMYMEDLESIFPSREEMGNSSGDRSAFNTLINEIQGVGTGGYDNYLIVGTTNKPEQLDDALKQRFNAQLEAEGPTEPAEYGAILQHHLEQYLPDGTVEIDEWTGLGDLITDLDITGRDIDNITKNIANERSMAVEIDDTFYDQESDEQIQAIRDAIDPISLEELEEQLHAYAAEQKRQQERAYETRIEEQLEQLEIEQEAQDRFADDT